MILNPETICQIQLVEWIKRKTDLPFYHFAGERKCSPQMGAILKRMGTKSGVSDLFFPRSNHQFKGLWLELKVGKNKATPSQLKFIDEMTLEGYSAMVAYGFDEAQMMIKSFYQILS